LRLITSGQIKAARALLGLTVAELAKTAGIGFTTMVRLESADGVPAGNVKTLTSVKTAIEKAGVEFIGTPEEGAGVRWQLKK
jgi:DNA-binding XRE family transcriptional regulator